MQDGIAELERKEQEWESLVNEGKKTLKKEMKEGKERRWLAARDTMENIDEKEKQLCTSILQRRLKSVNSSHNSSDRTGTNDHHLGRMYIMKNLCHKTGYS